LVLSEVARYEMLADHNEKAIEVGREALGMAERLGLDDLRAHALNNIGCARAFMGDRNGMADLEQSIAIASRTNSVHDLIRGHNNLSTLYLAYGELERAYADREKTREIAEHFGHQGFVRFIDGGPRIVHPYLVGRWDQALDRANAFLVEVESGSPHYHAAYAYVTRGLIRLGRADSSGARNDAERAVELARAVGDPQLFQPTTVRAALLFFLLGDAERAAEALAEALVGLSELNQMGFASVESHVLAWLGVTLGREPEVVAILDREVLDTPWTQAARAILEGNVSGAADLLGEIGAVTPEAFYRLRRAEQLVTEGRRAEADEQLHRALAFYHSVGATQHLREGEALLAASA
jgi:tetratricopeptide (TPR) repeat protein